ncbi:MAG: MBL fold metallo-hydrolase [Candidatus Aminicenantales bacterium]
MMEKISSFSAARRIRLIKTPSIFFWIGLAILSFLVSAGAQQPQTKPQAQAPLEVKQVRANVYEVTGGSGANTGFIIGQNGVIIVDAKMTPESAQEMMAAVARVSSLPWQAVVLTHSDGDHVNGLVGFPERLPVIAHENTYQEMKQAMSEGALLNYLPSITYRQEMTLRSGNTIIQLLHFGPGHTSGDTVVYIPEAKVAFLGDLVFVGRDPLIHRQKGGNSFGVVKTLKEVLKLDADLFIHGHGEVLDRKGVEKAIAALEAKQEQVKALVAQGKSLDEVKAALNVQEPPIPPGRTRHPGLVEIIYLELTEKR